MTQRPKPRVKRAEWLRAQLAAGYTLAAVARAAGLPESTLRSWLKRPPEPGVCPSCGGELRDPRAARCHRCESRSRRGWTDEGIVEARERWIAAQGRPPTTYDWNPTHARRRGQQPAGAWPAASTVIRRFGSWQAFLDADRSSIRAGTTADRPSPIDSAPAPGGSARPDADYR